MRQIVQHRGQREPQRDERQRFLARYHNEATVAAWHGYQAAGRGALVSGPWHEASARPELCWSFGATLTCYLPESKMGNMYDSLSANALHVIAALVAQYNPEHELVWIFLDTDGGLYAYRMVATE